MKIASRAARKKRTGLMLLVNLVCFQASEDEERLSLSPKQGYLC